MPPKKNTPPAPQKKDGDRPSGPSRKRGRVSFSPSTEFGEDEERQIPAPPRKIQRTSGADNVGSPASVGTSYTGVREARPYRQANTDVTTTTSTTGSSSPSSGGTAPVDPIRGTLPGDNVKHGVNLSAMARIVQNVFGEAGIPMDLPDIVERDLSDLDQDGQSPSNGAMFFSMSRGPTTTVVSRTMRVPASAARSSMFGGSGPLNFFGNLMSSQSPSRAPPSRAGEAPVPHPTAASRTAPNETNRTRQPRWANMGSIDVMPHSLFGLMPGIHRQGHSAGEGDDDNDNDNDNDDREGMPHRGRVRSGHIWSIGDFLPDHVDLSQIFGSGEPAYAPDPEEVARKNTAVATAPAPKVKGVPICVICKVANVQTRFDPCAHVAVCAVCYDAMKYNAPAADPKPKCPICRVPITGIQPLIFCSEADDEDEGDGDGDNEA